LAHLLCVYILIRELLRPCQVQAVRARPEWKSNRLCVCVCVCVYI